MPARKIVPAPATLDVPLHPRSAQILLDAMEQVCQQLDDEPQYVVIDLCNLRNHLQAHLQRVALGE